MREIGQKERERKVKKARKMNRKMISYLHHHRMSWDGDLSWVLMRVLVVSWRTMDVDEDDGEWRQQDEHHDEEDDVPWIQRDCMNLVQMLSSWLRQCLLVCKFRKEVRFVNMLMVKVTELSLPGSKGSFTWTVPSWEEMWEAENVKTGKETWGMTFQRKTSEKKRDDDGEDREVVSERLNGRKRVSKSLERKTKRRLYSSKRGWRVRMNEEWLKEKRKEEFFLFTSFLPLLPSCPWVCYVARVLYVFNYKKERT